MLKKATTAAVRFMTSSASHSSTKVALLLCGSGVYDGSEITEAVSAIIHLSRSNASTTMFAADKNQMHVINHTTGEPSEGETRNCLVESARIARGKISPLSECSASDFDALVVPGGFGAAKNLCNFATAGADMEVDPNVKDIILDFVSQKKVIGLSCIAPVLAPKLIPGVKVTVGMNNEMDGKFPYAEAAGAIEKMGGVHINTEPPCDKACIDEKNRVVTCAAYMYDAKPHVVDDSVKAMVDNVLDMVKRTNSS